MSPDMSSIPLAGLAASLSRWRVTRVRIDTMAGGTFPALGPDAERWCIIATAEVGNAFLIDDEPPAGALAHGLPIPVTWPALVLTVRDHGILPALGWSVFAPLPGLSVRVWGISWR